MDLGRAAEKTGHAVPAHRLGLFVAVPDQFDGGMACRTHQDPVRIGGQPLRPLLQPDVTQDPAAGEDGDGHPFTEAFLRVGRDMNGHLAALQMFVDA